MGAPLDLINKTFGRLTVMSRAENRLMPNGDSRRAWNCKCECGNEIVATTMDLRSGDVKSCGCLKAELDKAFGFKHGDNNTRLHTIWTGMRQRCRSENSADSQYYFKKGIRVYDEWDKDYLSFKNWSLSNGYSDELTIDRIDVNGDYSPENCRWVDMKAQANNRSNSKYITYLGETHTIQEWSEIKNIKYSTLYMRFRAGWSPERALA